MTFKIMVSGLKRSKVTRYQSRDGEWSIADEEDLGYLFYDMGCNVVDVRLMIDTKSDKSRGFGFVDFEDAVSLEKAMKLDTTAELTSKGNLGARRLADDVHGPVKVEIAKKTKQDEVEQARRLAAAKDATEQLERELHLHMARIQQLSRELDTKRRRQADAIGPRDAQAALEAELARQEEINRKVASLKQAEELLSGALRLEDERTRSLEELLPNVEETQMREHVEDEEVPPDATAPGAIGGELPDDLQAWGGPPPVKNTFIHFSEDYYPMPPEALVRLKTAPALLSFQEHSAAPGGASPPSFEPPPRGAAAQADDAGSVPPPWALKRTTSVQSNASAGRSRAASAAAPCGWEDGADHAGAPGKPGPLVRGSSAEVSRQLLEEKMGGPAAAAAGSEPSSPRALAAAADIQGLAPRAPLWRREVRLKNLPVLPEAELRTLVLAELERVWRTARAAGLPAVDELRLGAEGGRHPGGAGDAPASWAQAAQRAAGTEATVVFADADDASWLVDGRAGSSWAGPENLTLRGRPVQVEWASGAGAETDWRKLAYKAGTDASSHVSYGSEGTRRSCSGAVARKAAEQLARRAAEGGQAAAPPAAADRKNRTVMLEGLPRSLPIHHVVDEVSAQLRQLWTRDGYSAPELHGQGGIVVKKPLQGSRDENGGSCLVRFLWPAHARWLVEQKKIKIKVGAQDIQLRACWAKPREV